MLRFFELGPLANTFVGQFSERWLEPKSKLV